MVVVASDDKRLVQAHQAGEADAFSRIVERYHGSLHRRAVQRLGDSHAAEDAVQETFLRAFRSLSRFNGEYRLGGWLRRILENVCADEGSRRSLETGAFQRWGSMPVVDVDLRTPDGVVDELAARRRLDGAWRLLPPAHREALVLRFVHDLSFREVAAATGVTEDNARARVSRARSALRGMLGGASAMAVFAFTAFRRTERAVALAVERTGQAGTAQLAADTVSVAGPAKAGILASVIATVAVSVAAPVALLLPTGSDRSTPPTPAEDVVPLTAPAPTALSDPSADASAVPAVDPIVTSGGQAQRRLPTPLPLVPVTPTLMPPAPAVDVSVAPAPVQASVLPEGLVELVIPLGGLSFEQHGGRIEFDGDSLVLTDGDLVLTGGLEIKLRFDDDAGRTAESGRINGRLEFVDANGVAHDVRLRGELVEAATGDGSSSYRFEGDLRVGGGGSVPFAAEVTVPSSATSAEFGARPSSTGGGGVEVSSPTAGFSAAEGGGAAKDSTLVEKAAGLAVPEVEGASGIATEAGQGELLTQP